MPMELVTPEEFERLTGSRGSVYFARQTSARQGRRSFPVPALLRRR